MFYIYSLLLPIAIVVTFYFMEKPKPIKLIGVIDFLLKALVSILLYALFLYFLELNFNIEGTEWSFYTVFFFTIPIGVILLMIKLYYFLKES